MRQTPIRMSQLMPTHYDRLNGRTRAPRMRGATQCLVCLAVLIAVGVAALCRPAQAGQAPSTFGIIVEGKLTIGLPGQAPQVLDRWDLAKLPQTTVKVKDADGKAAVYRGVLVHDLLEAVGMNLRGQRTLGSYVMVEAVEEHHVLFALTEFDPTLTRKRVIVADTKNGKPMIPPEGPFRIIVPDEQKPTRWVRQVWAIYVVPDS